MSEPGSHTCLLVLSALVMMSQPASAADGDADGIDDSVDVCCDTPQGVPVDASGRPRADLDWDCDVDQSDFGLLQASLTGPMVAPDCPRCNDGILNGGETDIDCGGSTCVPCSADELCVLPSDCSTGLCTGGICQTTCGDGVVGSAEACDDGNTLNGDGCTASCAVQANWVCSGSPSVCTPLPSCGDAIRNAAETDVDCGGVSCPACADGKTCLTNSDCLSGNCLGGICLAPCSIKINEVQTGSVGITTDEWIELYNPCSVAFDVAIWELVYRAPSNSIDVQVALLFGTIPPDGYRLYVGSGYTGSAIADGTLAGTLGGAGGNIMLRDVGEIPVDQLGYGSGTAFAEGGQPAPAAASGQSIGRSPNGFDTNSNLNDFTVFPSPSPKAPNP